MKMQKILALSAFLTISFVAEAQVNVGIESNSQYYTEDDKIKLDDAEKDDPFRSNNYIKVDYLKNHFEVGVQVEGYLPKAILNYSPDLEKFNIGTVYARYNNYEKGVDFTVGHFYEQFGSGLVLRSWEDRALGINNALFGSRLKLRLHPSTHITLLGGKQRIGMGFDLSDGVIYGVNTEVDITNLMNKEDYVLKFGASFVGRYEDIRKEYPTIEPNTNMISTRLEYVGSKISVSGEYVYKTEDALVENLGTVFPDKSKSGNALLLNLGYTDTGFAANVNLRRMENMTFYSERALGGNQYNVGVVNYLPALTKQYDYALQNIFVYQSQPKYGTFNVDKLGEIGGQFDVFYELPKESFLGGAYGANLIVNGSYWAGLKTEPEADGNLKTTGYLDFGKKYYRDIAVEYRRKWSDKFSSIFMYLNQYYNKEYVEETYDEINSNVAVAEGLYFFNPTSSLRLELQHQWADGYRKNWAGGTLEYTPNSKFSFFVHDIYNYGNDDEDMRIHYYSFGGSFTKGATRIAASYGRQRGGLMCVGGVCRMVPEAMGFTLNITTNF